MLLPLLLQASAASPPDFALFLGRFHPLVVHLPIGFLLLAGLLEWQARRRDRAAWQPAIRLTLGLGAVSAVAAVGLGYLLAWGGGYDATTLFWHRWSGLGVALFSVGAYVLKTRTLRAVPSFVYPGLLVGMLVLLPVAGHLGGNLTHGSAYLVQYAPNPVRRLAGLPPKKVARPPVTDLDSAEVFADLVQPIFEARCVSCHNETKRKGGLLMTSAEGLLAGGDGGAVLVAGDAQASDLFRRVELPPTHDDFMPEGKSPLDDPQRKILAWWINEGMPFTAKVAEVSVSDELREILRNATGLQPIDDSPLAQEVPSAPEEVVSQLRAQGFRVQVITQTNGWLDVGLAAPGQALTAPQLDALLQAQAHITWLDLSGSTLPPAVGTVLAQLPHLTRLRLERTSVTDEAIAQLQPLAHLQYLNLYGTNVTDACLKTLQAMPALRRVFLWRTAVTPEGAAQVREHTDLQLNLGQVPSETALSSTR
ncbi:Uncharacterized membrane protein [Catalinimonas alkaloidigena]|uniref:Uncharacterized membrane protein n=1 Tax=Catalinimonas alkaloidigena TaxID=1075417 RepID=A0A1G8XJK2_9BACT|nr:c-type cytochrome domain-containing protein [Catalinimonas alkaloidigena]SDJ90085.1 Uncharacterized membrane protein [Catalinimonas alkaloidigena]